MLGEYDNCPPLARCVWYVTWYLHSSCCSETQYAHIHFDLSTVFLPLTSLTWGNVPGPPHFTVLQATKSWAWDWEWGYTVVHNFPKILGKLNACANSGYQALSFSGGAWPGYEASINQHRSLVQRLTPMCLITNFKSSRYVYTYLPVSSCEGHWLLVHLLCTAGSQSQ